MMRRQRGVAIVLAMSVVALAALGATAILVSQSTWARQSELAAGRVQAQRVIQAGLEWARAVLADDRSLGEVDHPGEPWALRLPMLPVENGSLAGRIEDQQGRFNLNNLQQGGKASAAQLAHFRRLLSILDLPPALADALADWVDADGIPQPGDGAEDAAYLALGTPYLAANRPLIDVAELALVRGFDGRVRDRLRPFVSALPRFTPVNVNTASPEVLCAIVDKLALDDARTLVARRSGGFHRTFQDFLEALPRGLAASPEDVSVGSDYFLASMDVTIGGAQAQGSALLARGKAGWPEVVWRKLP
jgi:general secretion pathway protein K